MPKCSIVGCKSHQLPQYVSYHRLIYKGKVRQEWKQAIESLNGQVIDTHQAMASFSICNIHFEKKYIRTLGTRMSLTADAVPSFFPKMNECKDTLNEDLPELKDEHPHEEEFVDRNECHDNPNEDLPEPIVHPDEEEFVERFPLENAALCEVWKERLELPSSFVPTKYNKICSDHFAAQCFNLNNKQLIPGSVPSFFSEREHACFYCNATRDSKPGLSLRKFPLDKPYLMDRWLAAINMEYFLPDKNCWICSDHFEESCFLEKKNRSSLNLKHYAVPTIFFKAPKALQFEEVFLEEPKRKSVKINRNDAVSVEAESHETNDVSTSYNKDSQNSTPNSEESCEQETPQIQFNPATLRNPATIQENQTTVNHDHRYHSTPASMMKELKILREKFKESQQLIKIQKRHISRLVLKVKSSNDKIKELKTWKNNKKACDGMCVVSKTKLKNKSSKNGLTISKQKNPSVLR